MKLNIGSGITRLEGYKNVDINPNVFPDYVLDISRDKFPIEVNEVTDVKMHYLLEYINPNAFFYFMVDLYRISAPNTIIEIKTTAPTHESFYDDYSPRFPITKNRLKLFSKTQNQQDIENRKQTQYLGLQYNVDFEFIEESPIYKDSDLFSYVYKLKVIKPKQKMEHFYPNIHGWFNFYDIYNFAVYNANNKAHFVEVGSWLGRSSAYMGVEIVNSNKSIKFDCIDTWQGTQGEHDDFEEYQNNTLFETFTENMKPLDGFYNAIRLPSLEAAKLYPNNSLDFVFIDAAHDYINVDADIKAWLPKVKSGGILAGHDINFDGVAQAVKENFLEHEIEISCMSWIHRKQ